MSRKVNNFEWKTAFMFELYCIISNDFEIYCKCKDNLDYIIVCLYNKYRIGKFLNQTIVRFLFFKFIRIDMYDFKL